MKALILTLTLSGLVLTSNEDHTRVETSSRVSAEMDGCLDHSIKELGMSAKPRPNERAWNIGPQFLHPSVVPDGTLGVEFVKAQDGTTVRVLATWPGSPKEDAIQLELEERLRAMAHKMAQLCGVTKPEVKCMRTPAKGSSRPCPAPK